jgi:hypothetical protein
MGYRPGKGIHGLSTVLAHAGPPSAEGETMPKSQRKRREEALAEVFDLDSLRRSAAPGPQRAGLRLWLLRREPHPIRRLALLSQLRQVAQVVLRIQLLPG